MTRQICMTLLAGASWALAGCGSAADDSVGTGGGSAVGGGFSTGATGPTGGLPSGGFGAEGPELGGVPAGGVASGGLVTGGAPSGGTLTGGGGAATGGMPAGGASTGGTLSGGVSTGGGSTGGVPTGGALIGGALTGGAETGGTFTGGAPTGGGSTGGEPTGGFSTGGADAGCAGAAFELAWEDSFDTIDSSRWQFMTHTLGIAQFTGDNVSVSNGVVSLALTASPSGSAMPYQGVEMRSRSTLTYGKVESSIRFASGSGVISSLVLIYTPWPPDDWNEIDIEFLGKSQSQVQFNTMINVPPADPITGHLQYPHVQTLGYDATTEFRTYAMEWVPGEVRFLVDGALLHTATEEMSRMVLPQNILLTIWASEAVDWAGPVDGSTAPTTVEYDWIRVCNYAG